MRTNNIENDRHSVLRLRRRVLVVDGHEHLRRMIASCLGRDAFDVHELKDGYECLDWLQENPTPDLLVIGDELPVLPGRVVVERAHSIFRLARLPAVLVHAGTAPPIARTPLTRLVKKPVTARALQLAVNALLEDTEPMLPVAPVAGKQAVHFLVRSHDELASLHRTLAVKVGGKPLVLVVDDDPSICDALTLVLCEEGFDTIVATDGHDALRVIASGVKPALIVLDVMMPGMDGIQLAYRLRTDASMASVPLLLFSANDQVAAMAREIGAVGHVKKPADLVTLVDTIGTALNVSNAPAQTG